MNEPTNRVLGQPNRRVDLNHTAFILNDLTAIYKRGIRDGNYWRNKYLLKNNDASMQKLSIICYNH